MLFDEATWLGPCPNRSAGPRRVRLVVLHIMQGTYEGTVSWFKNPNAKVSADFLTAKDGRLGQMVDTDDTAWAQAAYNPYAVSIENEGRSGDRLTDAQVTRCAEILVWAHAHFGVPVAVTDNPEGAGLITHGLLGSAGGNHPDCPGTAIRAQRADIVTLAHRMLEGVPPMYQPPVICEPIVASLADPQGGAWCLADSGAVYAWGGARGVRGCNGRPYFQGRRAARLDLAADPAHLLTVTATSGETYNLPDGLP